MFRRFALMAAFLASPLSAEVPRVVTDIAPIQGLVASVMEDLGTPDLMIDPGASAHDAALRPSQAAALESASHVFWIGHALSPQLEGPIETLASQAQVIELLEVDGTRLFEMREEVIFEVSHSHDHDHGHNHGHDHGDHADDPHAWLDPQNALLWLAEISAVLSAADPENAAQYGANAAQARAEIMAAQATATQILSAAKDAKFVVFHDAYQYFTAAFDVQVLGAIAISDAARPSPARLLKLTQSLAQMGIACVFAEPQFDAGLAQTVADAIGAKVATLDPVGAQIPTGPDFYPALIQGLARDIATCL